MLFSCIIFDCDGVLLDSVSVKTKAFAHLAQPYGLEAQEKFVAYHNANGGVNRFQKFSWFFENILHRPITEEESKNFGERFTKFCKQELLSCKTIPGARETLEKLYKKIPLYVCTGAPKIEQESILQHHGLAHFFDAIYGAPPAKDILLKQIVTLANIQPAQALMVGDASTDLHAAKSCGTHFYGIGKNMASDDYPWAYDMTKLCDYVLQ